MKEHLFTRALVRPATALGAAAGIFLFSLVDPALAAKGGKPLPPPPPPCVLEPVLVFHHGTSGTDKDIVVANEDGTCQTVVADGSEVQFIDPNWLPDGSGIVFFGNAPQPGLYYLSTEDIELAKDSNTLPLTPHLLVGITNNWGGARPNPGPRVEELGNGDRVYEIVYSDDTPNTLDMDIHLLRVQIDAAGSPLAISGPFRLTDTPSVSEIASNWLGEDDLITEYCCIGSPGSEYRIFRLDRTTMPWSLTDGRSLFAGCEEVQSELGHASWSMMPSHDGERLAIRGDTDIVVVEIDNPCDGPVSITNNPEWDQGNPTWIPSFYKSGETHLAYTQRFQSKACGDRGGKLQKPLAVYTRPDDDFGACSGEKLIEFSAHAIGINRVHWKPVP
jgi:hypothetical protein